LVLFEKEREREKNIKKRLGLVRKDVLVTRSDCLSSLFNT